MINRITQIKNILDNYEMGHIDRDDYIRMLALKEELKELESKLTNVYYVKLTNGYYLSDDYMRPYSTDPYYFKDEQEIKHILINADLTYNDIKEIIKK